MKKKDKKSCIVVGERKCKKIGSDLFYNMDMSLAIVIRDMLYEFAETEALVGYPTYYTFTRPGAKRYAVSETCLTSTSKKGSALASSVTKMPRLCLRSWQKFSPLFGYNFF